MKKLFTLLPLLLGLVVVWFQQQRPSHLEQEKQTTLPVLPTPSSNASAQIRESRPKSTPTPLVEIVQLLGISSEGYKILSQRLNETLTKLRSLQEAEAFALELENALKDPHQTVPATLLGAYHVLSQQFPSLRDRYQKQMDHWPEKGLIRWLVER